MRVRSIGLLSIALCFYFIGGAALDSLGAVLPFACTVDMVLVGLFLPLLPRFEGACLYLFAAGVDIVEVILGIPYDQAKLTMAIEVAKAASTTPSTISEFFTIPPTLMVALVILACGFVAVTIFYAVKSIIEMGKTIIVIAAAFTPSLIVGMYWIVAPLLSSGSILSCPTPMIAETLVNAMAFAFIYMILTKPFYAIVFFRWLGVYRRLPALYGNS